MSETNDDVKASVHHSVVSLLNGKVGLGPLPALSDLNSLTSCGVTHLVTLQTEDEMEAGLQTAMLDASLKWLWMPLHIRTPLAEAEQAYLQQYLISFKKILNQSSFLYVHCDSNCKRSLLLVLAFCHYQGLSAGDSYRLIHRLDAPRCRHLTQSERRWAEQLGESAKLSRQL
ncbi:hypothetical protein OPS25_13455 [Alteromonas ponticola]|uniref:Tyrosine specific protein phosphatases domain-containing protein n=1 Tax=Alteromonas aquimaris TaxID=2998417 RepID=A0ABT3P9Q2_9ALTE|nr:hypothetical protein [Alteromonas aquimaris]MCW8109511.1 hypothetical protein [Alteromonas aquimaris]